MTVQRRQKLSDLRAAGNQLFPYERRKLADAFPHVEGLTVEVEDSDMGFRISGTTRTFDLTTMPGIIDCANALCYGGGLDLGFLLMTLPSNRSSTLEKLEICRGFEGSPKGGRRYKPCHKAWHVSLDVRVRPSPE